MLRLIAARLAGVLSSRALRRSRPDAVARNLRGAAAAPRATAPSSGSAAARGEAASLAGRQRAAALSGDGAAFGLFDATAALVAEAVRRAASGSSRTLAALAARVTARAESRSRGARALWCRLLRPPFDTRGLASRASGLVAAIAAATVGAPLVACYVDVEGMRASIAPAPRAAPQQPGVLDEPAADAASLSPSLAVLEQVALEQIRRIEPCDRKRVLAELCGESEVPPEFVCPITQDVMEDPVVAADGASYERAALERWLDVTAHSPLTRVRLSKAGLVPNLALRDLIQRWRARELVVLECAPLR